MERKTKGGERKNRFILWIQKHSLVGTPYNLDILDVSLGRKLRNCWFDHCFQIPDLRSIKVDESKGVLIGSACSLTDTCDILREVVEKTPGNV